MAALADSYALLGRARRDVEALETATGSFGQGHPNAFVVKPEKQGTMYGVFLDPSQQPDTDWGIDFGIIGGHLRSALDYIPAYLANPGKAELSRTQFPICRGKTDYLRKNQRGITYRDQMLTGVPDPLKRFFDNQQPYKRGDDPDDGPLGLLTWITNRHKHRKLHPSLVTMREGDFLVTINGAPWVRLILSEGVKLGVNPESHIFAVAHDPLAIVLPSAADVGKGGQIAIASLAEAPGDGLAHFNVQGNLSTEVAFGERCLRARDLWPILDRVKEIVDIFEPLAPVV